MMLPIHASRIPVFVLENKVGIYDTLMGLVLPQLAFAIPISVFIASQFLDTIPPSLLEAAKVDGANHYQMFFQVVLPLLRPAIVTIVIYNGVRIWNNFSFALVFTQSKRNYTIPLGFHPVVDTQRYRYTDGLREIYPQGLLEELLRLHRATPSLPLFITENGADYRGTSLHDTKRIEYLREHLSIIRTAIAQGVPIRGYLIWTLMDNFEWENGYTGQYGIFAVTSDKKRLAKDSALWYKSIITTNGSSL